MALAINGLRLGVSALALGCATVGQAQSTDAPAPPSAPSLTPGQNASAGDPASATPADGLEVTVTGIRASQRRAVGLKREAASVQDSISAEDIGKLPDVTIADSLQRVPGVQILRTAGEGADLNVRGLGQVTTLLNGESFLSANSITALRPNFSDIPSQLFAGADVIKSATADLLNAGITGTVNLRTRRPLDLKRGLTLAAAAEGSYGDRVKHKFDPNVNGLIGWNGERVGFLLSAAYADVRLSNSKIGLQDNLGGTLRSEGLADATSAAGFSPVAVGIAAARPRGTPVAGGIDVNGDGDANDVFLAPGGVAAFQRINERKRLGINGSFQAKLSDSLTFTADGFFTRQNEYVRTAGFQLQPVNSRGAEFLPTQSRDTGALVPVTVQGVTALYHFNTVQNYSYDLGNFDPITYLDHFRSQSQNYNAQLVFDNGGPFKATIRGLYGKAYQDKDSTYVEFNLSNGQQWHNGIGHYPASLGGDRVFNAGGYTVSTIAGVSSLKANVDFRGATPVLTLPTQLLNEIGDQNFYGFKTTTSEANYHRTSDLKIARADFQYTASPALRIEAGGRYAERSVRNVEFDRDTRLYGGQGATDPAGCLVKFKAFDVVMNNSACSAGDALGPYTAGLARKATDPFFAGTIIRVDPKAPGVPAVFVVDPKSLDDIAAFQERLYPGEFNIINPGNSYSVGVKQLTGYFQLNGEGELLGMPIHVNGGLKVVNTKLDISQNLTGATRPYGVAALLAGTTLIKRDFTDYLPNFNLALDLSSRLKLRLAYTQNTTLLNLDQWGGGLTIRYALEASTGHFAPTGANQVGNPLLEPWRSTNYDASLEYYVGKSSLLSVALFKVDVDSFVQNGTVPRSDFADSDDGVVRNRAAVGLTTPVQGDSGTLKGVEGAARIAFNDLGFMPAFLSSFGIDTSATYSPSKTRLQDLAGKDIPFQDNSKFQANAAVYYQDSRFQARVAYNYRSTRAVVNNYGGTVGLEEYQLPTQYVDASVSFDLNPHLTIYAQGSNLTGERERYYLTWKDERLFNNLFERRYTVGVRTRF